MIERTIQEAVANGAQMLDERVPSWHKLINLDDLSLQSCTACVCGQLGRQLGWSLFPAMSAYPNTYGFDIPDGVFDERDLPDDNNWWDGVWAMMDREWQQAIRARLELDKRAPIEEKEEAREELLGVR